MFKVINKYIRSSSTDVISVSLLLTVNKSHTLFHVLSAGVLLSIKSWINEKESERYLWTKGNFMCKKVKLRPGNTSR